jgi:hypothetical protein
MSNPMTGGCRCGQVRYTYDDEPIASMICHCSGCFKRVGPFAGGMFVRKDSWKITGEYHSYDDIGGTGRPVHMFACTKCGSYFGGLAEAVPMVGILLAASLDDQSRFKPAFHNWAGSRPSWVTINDGLPQFEKSVDWDKIGGRPNFGTPRVAAPGQPGQPG